MLFTPTQSAVVLGGLDPAKDCGRRRYNTPASIALPGAWGGADSSMRRSDDSIDLRQKLTHADAVISELRNLVVKLRKGVESQQAHIHRLKRILFARGGEGDEGSRLFDGIVASEAEMARSGIDGRDALGDLKVNGHRSDRGRTAQAYAPQPL